MVVWADNIQPLLIPLKKSKEIEGKIIMALPTKPKRGRGRPKRLDAVYHKAQEQKVDLFEEIDILLPNLFGQLKRMAQDPQHRQQLSSIKELLAYHNKFLEKLEEEENAARAAEDAASEASSAPSQKDSLASMVSFEWQEDKESQAASKLN